MTIPARISIVTLGVADVAVSAAFYERLGWQRAASSMAAIAWFRTADSWLGLFGADALAAEANLGSEPGRPASGGFTLAVNVETEAGVATALEAAVAAGATLLKPATNMPWGGVSGYFADLDGHPWEVAWNPAFPIGPDGRITIP
jgi:catechol 2,3-dioxygenase-like lactoylglutathione lyase family enzyme